MTTTQPMSARQRVRRRGPGLLVPLALALLLALLLRTFVVQSFSIPSDSMSPLLVPGERVLVWRVGAGEEVQRGDVVVFDGTGTFVPSPPAAEGLARLGAGLGSVLGFRPGESDFVKRVIGLPGDRITCCDPSGRLLVNGVAIEEPYVAAGDAPSDLAFDIEVPAGRLWLMGDHRSDSADSRAHLGSPGGGTVALDDVVGRVAAVTWPLGSLASVPPRGFLVSSSDGENSAAAEARDPVTPSEPPPKRSAAGGVIGLLRETVLVVAVALVVSLVVKTFLLQAFFIPSESMEQTLDIGDRVIVSKLTPGPFELHRGDVVVFSDPGGWLPETVPTRRGAVGTVVADALTFVGLLPEDSDDHLIKRTIGLPGDHVVCCNADGKITVNDVALDETYLFPGAEPSDDAFDVIVPAGELWVMGDNREHSCDSRCNRDKPYGGFVPLDDVVGRAYAIVWPVSHWDWLQTPSAAAKVPGVTGTK